MSDSAKIFEDKYGELMIQRVPEMAVEILNKMIRKNHFQKRMFKNPRKGDKI